jgi:hypothetical protein
MTRKKKQPLDELFDFFSLSISLALEITKLAKRFEVAANPPKYEWRWTGQIKTLDGVPYTQP